jgi:alcohol dehydrogenase, propanol-preferring
MQAWWVETPGPIDGHPLRFGKRPRPQPGPGEIRIRVSACGVCRTDLHLAEGDLPPRRSRTVPGHEIVGTVDRCGEGADRFVLGERVGGAWLRRSCGTCRFCRRHAENLCLDPSFTGWDADGGYAQCVVVPEDWAYRIPPGFTDIQAAPLLCAGIIGYRALRRAELPAHGRLGIYGLGASGHLALQIAHHQGATVHVMTRSPAARDLALQLGASSAGPADAAPPEPLDAAILFAPAGELVPVALQALDRGGTLSIAGIHLSDIPPLDYTRDLFQERQIRSVTANTRDDGEALLDLAARIPLRPKVQPYPLERADEALRDLAQDRIDGVAVLEVESDLR